MHIRKIKPYKFLNNCRLVNNQTNSIISLKEYEKYTGSIWPLSLCYLDEFKNNNIKKDNVPINKDNVPINKDIKELSKIKLDK